MQPEAYSANVHGVPINHAHATRHYITSSGDRRNGDNGQQHNQPLTAACGLEYVPDGKGNLLTTWGPEDALHYIYAVLHSPAYRARYAEFLKIDFPRIPMPDSLETFAALAWHGAELTALHLLDSELETFVTFPNAGLNVVDKPRYAPPTDDQPGRVFINDAQCFAGISPALWAHRVGGYQVLEKWLKDRKGRALSFDDITHYAQVCAALERTALIMLEIDGVVDEVGGFPLQSVM